MPVALLDLLLTRPGADANAVPASEVLGGGLNMGRGGIGVGPFQMVSACRVLGTAASLVLGCDRDCAEEKMPGLILDGEPQSYTGLKGGRAGGCMLSLGPAACSELAAVVLPKLKAAGLLLV